MRRGTVMIKVFGALCPKSWFPLHTLNQNKKDMASKNFTLFDRGDRAKMPFQSPLAQLDREFKFEPGCRLSGVGGHSLAKVRRRRWVDLDSGGTTGLLVASLLLDKISDNF